MLVTRIDQHLHKAILFCFYFLFLATPLIWFAGNSELFELPKMMFVYAMSIVLGCLWLARIINQGPAKLTQSWFNKLILAYVLSQMLATIFSIHPLTSIQGFYTRFHGGLLSTLAYTLLYFVYINNFKSKDTIKTLSVLILSGFIVSLIAFPEHFGYALSCLLIGGRSLSLGLGGMLAATCWQQDIVSRIFGTFGQPNWLAAYIITILPLVWAASYYYYHKVKSYRHLLILGISMLMTATLLFTKSRSGLLGFAVSLGLYVLITAVLTRLQNRRHLFEIIASTLIVVAIFGSAYTPSVSQLFSRYYSTSSAPAPPTDDETSGLTVLDRGGTESGEIRQIVWQGAWDMFLSHPLFGTGVETFAYSYYNYRPVRHNLVSEWDFLYNKAHNEFLNVAATTGIVGLATYLAVIAWSYFKALHLSRQTLTTKTSFPRHIYAVALIAGLTGLHISNFFGFSTVSVGVLFFIYPAILVTLDLKAPQVTKKSQPLSSNQKLALAGLALVSLGLLYQVGKYYYADLLYARAQRAESANNYLESIEAYEHALRLLPHQPIYYNGYASVLSKATYALAMDDQADLADTVMTQTQLAAYKTLQLNPVHINFYKAQASVFIRLSALEPELLDQAATILEQAYQLAPSDAKIAYNLGLIRLDQEATPQAQQYLEQAVNLKPNYEAARMELAQLYEAQDQADQALNQYLYILNYIAPQNSIARQAVERLEASQLISD